MQRVDNAIREALADSLGLLAYKARTGQMTDEDVTLIARAIREGGGIRATVRDLAAFGSSLIAEAMDRQRTAAEQQARAAAEERLLKADEAGQLLGVSARTLARWRKRGYLDAVTLGGQVRYRQSDCRRILETGKPEA